MPFEDHFSDRAADYGAYRPGYPSALVDWLADLAPRRALAWDAGCGSGQLSVPLAERFDRVVATDASAEQLAHAASHPRVEYRQARAEASGLQDGAVDLAVAAQAAHWFDLDTYYAEVRRVCAPGAAVALVSYGVMAIGDPIDRAVRSFYTNVLGPYWPSERRHVETGYASLPFPFESLPAPALEIRAEWLLEDLLGYVGTWSAVRGLEQARGRTLVDDLREELRRVWGDAAEARTIRWPLSVRAGRVSPQRG